MSFEYKGNRIGTHPTLVKVVLYNSLTFKVGEPVQAYSNGDATHGAAGYPILGIIHAIVGNDGLPVATGGNTAGTANGPTKLSVTTGSDNTTTKLYCALVDVSPFSLYSASVSGTLGTTNSSDKMGCRLDCNSAGSVWGELLESTATRTLGTDANFYSWGKDPDDATRLLVSIAASEVNLATP